MNASNEKLKRTLQVLVNLVADDDDERTVQEEYLLFAKFISDTNRSRKAESCLMSSFIEKNPIMEPPKKKPKNVVSHDDSFCDITVPRMSLDTFKSYFGMKRSTFQSLLEKLQPFTYNYPHTLRVSLEKRTLLALFILCNQETFRNVGKRFGMAQGNCHYVFFSVCTSVCKLSEKFIVWPDQRRQRANSQQFMKRFGFPNTVGAIGVTQITIKTPDFNANTFFNRTGIPCIILQAVCDHNLSFMDVYVGHAGSVAAGQVYRCSPIHEKLKSVIEEEFHLVGEGSYPLTSSLLIPFRDKGKLNERQRLYNTIHKPVRSVVQNAFSKLKTTFKRLKFLDMQRIDLVVKVVLSACTLHNIIIECEKEDDDEEYQASDILFSELQMDIPDKESGAVKRDSIADSFIFDYTL